MTDQPLDVEEIRKRAEAASGGPWLLGVGGQDDGLRNFQQVTMSVYEVRVQHPNGEWACIWTRRQEDSDFIVHAREDIPALLAALREAQEDIKAQRCPSCNARNRATLEEQLREAQEENKRLREALETLLEWAEGVRRSGQIPTYEALHPARAILKGSHHD